MIMDRLGVICMSVYHQEKSTALWLGVIFRYPNGKRANHNASSSTFEPHTQKKGMLKYESQDTPTPSVADSDNVLCQCSSSHGMLSAGRQSTLVHHFHLSSNQRRASGREPVLSCRTTSSDP